MRYETQAERDKRERQEIQRLRQQIAEERELLRERAPLPIGWVKHLMEGNERILLSTQLALLRLSGMPNRERRRSNAGRKKGRNQFPPEECDDLARQSLELRSPPVRPWSEIEERLGVPEKTLRRYIKQLQAREGQ